MGTVSSSDTTAPLDLWIYALATSFQRKNKEGKDRNKDRDKYKDKDKGPRTDIHSAYHKVLCTDSLGICAATYSLFVWERNKKKVCHCQPASSKSLFSRTFLHPDSRRRKWTQNLGNKFLLAPIGDLLFPHVLSAADSSSLLLLDVADCFCRNKVETVITQSIS